MKRLLPAFLAFSMISQFLIGEAFAATSVKAGSSCTKLNSTVISSGFKFQCVKSGKKLVWKSIGVVKTNPTPSPSPSPSASPTATLSATPTASKSSDPEVLQYKNLLTFQELLNRRADIPSIAFTATQDLLQFNQKKELPAQPFTFRIAPGLTVDTSKYQDAIKKANQFFANFLRPISFLGILYSAKDMDWAKTVFDSETGFADHDMMVKAPFGGDPNSTGGGANANVIENHGITVYGYYKGFDTDLLVTSMSMTTHEYVHQIQTAQFSPKLGDQGTQSNETMPCWITEGQANFNGIGIATNSLDEYLKVRDFQAHSLILRNATNYNGNPEITKSELTPDYISKYYDQMNITKGSSCIRSTQYGLGYSLGMLTVEALSAIKGPDSTMILVQKLGTGKTFEQSFQEVYGEKWSDVKGILAQLVSVELQTILT